MLKMSKAHVTLNFGDSTTVGELALDPVTEHDPDEWCVRPVVWVIHSDNFGPCEGQTKKQRVPSQDCEPEAAVHVVRLTEENERLRQRDRMKDKFISDILHELRNPLQSLKIYMELLECSSGDEREQYVHTLQEQLDQMQELVEDISEFSHLGQEKLQDEIAAVDLNIVVEDAVNAQRPRAEANGLSLTFQPIQGLAQIPGVAKRLAQLCTNLLANAINYTPAGQISVTTRQCDAYVCLEIEDTGTGIDATDQHHIFERFYRGQNARETGVTGTGLGLSIVKEIVGAHQGRLELKSEVGQGTTVHVYLPLKD